MTKLQKLPQNDQIVFRDLGTDQEYYVPIRRISWAKGEDVKLDYK